jgi:aspartate-semialdehyde dehydrogenase
LTRHGDRRAEVPIGRLRKLAWRRVPAFTVGDQLLAAEPLRRMLRILLAREAAAPKSAALAGL